MKKIILLYSLCLLSSTLSIAQCTSIGTSFGNNASVPMYNITGANSVQVVLNTNNTITLNTTAAFNTAPGPDVRVYLVNPGSLTNTQLIATNPTTLPNIYFGMVSTNNSNPDGVHSFTTNIPAGVNISNYTKIFFYCFQFNAFWDFGSIVPFTTENCAVLSTEDFVSNKFKVYPNPSKGIISINFEQSSEIKSLEIYSVLGQKVVELNEAIIANTNIDLSHLKTGIYYMYLIDNDNNKITKKIILEN